MVWPSSEDAGSLAPEAASEVQNEGEEGEDQEVGANSTGWTSSAVTCKDWMTGKVTARTARSEDRTNRGLGAV